MTDLTEFRIPAGKVYLSPVIDCYDGMPVSWTIGTSPNAELANRMLRDACSTLGDGEHPIIHSDRGCHYRWPGWIRICGEHKLTRSMSAKGCSPDNAAAEGFFGRLKQESSPRARLRQRHHQGVHRTTGRIHDLVPGREDQTHFRHQHRKTKTRARTHGIIKEQGHRSPTKRHHPHRSRRFDERHMALMYVPHGMPTNSHNRSSNRCAASSYFGLRPRPGPGPSFALAACESRRRAVDRPMPTATKRSSTSPFYFLLPLAHSALNLFARRFLVAKSSPPSIRPSIHPKPDQAMRDFALTIYDKQTKITRSNITTNVATTSPPRFPCALELLRQLGFYG